MFAVGKSYTCNTDGIGGYTKTTSTHNGKPVFSFSQNIFSLGQVVRITKIESGYRSPVVSGDTAMNFSLMDNGWYVPDFNEWAFTEK